MVGPRPRHVTPPRRAPEVGGLPQGRAPTPRPREHPIGGNRGGAHALFLHIAFVAARRPQPVPSVRACGMAGPRLLPPGLPVLLLLLALPVLPLPAGDAAPSHCGPDQFQCTPGDPCFPLGWRCDGHPDCDDGEDEWSCGTATAAEEPSPGGPAVTLPRSSAVPPTGSAGLLIILVVASSVAVWGLSKAKRRSDTSSLEKASREQLMPGKGQKGSLP
ncbi:CD320 antigen isoform X2 [Molothrus ater]|uniref:CD320 antigen isoform X2 n=1 Tax=Molothrus ater TaxID=84834 RepID=UPI00174D673B|nr:CD320 antigen isoform X2 [Molothrus ater]